MLNLQNAFLNDWKDLFYENIFAFGQLQYLKESYHISVELFLTIKGENYSAVNFFIHVLQSLICQNTIQFRFSSPISFSEQGDTTRFPTAYSDYFDSEANVPRCKQIYMGAPYSTISAAPALVVALEHPLFIPHWVGRILYGSAQSETFQHPRIHCTDLRLLLYPYWMCRKQIFLGTR